MPARDGGWLRRAGPLLLLVALTCAGLWEVYFRAGFSLAYPIDYQGDSIQHLMIVKRLLEGAWYLDNHVQGYPFGARLHDVPGADFGSLLILKALVHATGSPVLAVNLYFLASFPVTALVTYVVLRRLELSRPFAVCGALLFAFAPFHILRVWHLYYAWYWVVPVFFLIALRLASDSPRTAVPTAGGKAWTGGLLLLALSSFGVYYAFFGVLLLLAGGVLGSLARRQAASLGVALAASAIVSAGVALNVAPSVAERLSAGGNPEVARRVAPETEVLGLKLTQLLLPHPTHRVAGLAAITQSYSAGFPLVNENVASALGLVGSAGLLWLLLQVLLAPLARERVDARSGLLGALVVVLILCATIGGFASFFSMAVTPLIRAWNRIGIFVAFAAMAGAMLLAESLLARRTHASSWPAAGVAALVALVGMWDQTPAPCNECYRRIRADFDHDRVFAGHLERLLPAGTPVYQLPYMAFPEGATLHGLLSYEHARAYLHSASLKWSFGAIKGREGDLFFRRLARQPLAVQVEVARELGFGGIYVDRRGFADHARQVENELVRLLGTRAVAGSADGTRFFYGFSPLPSVPGGGPDDAVVVERARALAQRYGL